MPQRAERKPSTCVNSEFAPAPLWLAGSCAHAGVISASTRIILGISWLTSGANRRRRRQTRYGASAAGARKLQAPNLSSRSRYPRIRYYAALLMSDADLL